MTAKSTCLLRDRRLQIGRAREGLAHGGHARRRGDLLRQAIDEGEALGARLERRVGRVDARWCSGLSAARACVARPSASSAPARRQCYALHGFTSEQTLLHVDPLPQLRRARAARAAPACRARAPSSTSPCRSRMMPRLSQRLGTAARRARRTPAPPAATRPANRSMHRQVVLELAPIALGLHLDALRQILPRRASRRGADSSRSRAARSAERSSARSHSAVRRCALPTSCVNSLTAASRLAGLPRVAILRVGDEERRAQPVVGRLEARSPRRRP